MNSFTDEVTVQAAVNRAFLAEQRVLKLELDKALLLNVMDEARKFCEQTKDLGAQLTLLKSMLETAQRMYG